MGNELKLMVCPYCGHGQKPTTKCESCGGLFDLFSLTATEIDMGPWFVRHDNKPFLPGFSYEVLRKRVASGRITKDTVLRGPTTRQLWIKAAHAPCVAHLLGSCHACGVAVKPTDSKCHACGALFTESTERQELGLRFRTTYQAATARTGLNRQIAEAEAKQKAAAEIKPSEAPPQPSQPKRLQKEDPAADDWNWVQAPRSPVDPEAEPAPAGDEATEAASSADESRFATQTLIHQPPPGPSGGDAPSAAAVFNATSRRYGAHAEHIDEAAPPPVVTPAGWLWILILGGLFILLFQHYLLRMLLIASSSPDWSHALVIPAISLYLIYQQRDHLRHAPKRVNGWGLLILFAGLFSYAFWIEPGRNDMFQGYSMIISLFGLLLLLLGEQVMKVLWLPIVYLMFAVKVSDALWFKLAAKLQLLAAQASTATLQFVGSFADLDATRRGTTIELSFIRDGKWITGQELNVAEACSGLRMLAAFMALGVMVAFMTPRARWQRLFMFAMTVPIALLVNIGRVTILGLLYPVNEDMAGGAFHQYVGLMMLVPALLLYLLIGWILDRVYVYDVHPLDKIETPPAPTEMPLAMTITQRISNAIKGALTGTMLCVLVGVTYGLALLTMRPDLASKDFSQSTGMQMMIGSLALLGGATWFVKKLIEPELYKPHLVGRTVTMGLSAGVLFASLLGMQGIIKAQKVVMIKDSIEWRQPFFQMANRSGPWEMVKDEAILEPAILKALGTRRYLSRVYRNTEDAPARLVKLHLAYYTGTPDTVPHVPERCFVAGGAQPVDESTVELNLTGPAYRRVEDQWRVTTPGNPDGAPLAENPIDATIFTFSSAGETSQQSNVIYFFSCNGHFFATPEGVRVKGFDWRDRYSYYCKIEVLLPDIADPAVATDISSGFLSHLMPEIIACLPNCSDVKAGRAPH